MVIKMVKMALTMVIRMVVYLQGLGRHQVNLDDGQQGVAFRMGLWVFPAANIDQNPIN